MEKAKILGIKKDEKRSEFIYDKSQSTINSIGQILIELEFIEAPEHNLRDLMYEGMGPGPKLEVKSFIDKVYSMSNKNYSVEVFFGINVIILVVLSQEDKQQEISEIINEYSDFKEIKNEH